MEDRLQDEAAKAESDKKYAVELLAEQVNVKYQFKYPFPADVIVSGNMPPKSAFIANSYVKSIGTDMLQGLCGFDATQIIPQHPLRFECRNFPECRGGFAGCPYVFESHDCRCSYIRPASTLHDILAIKFESPVIACMTCAGFLLRVFGMMPVLMSVEGMCARGYLSEDKVRRPVWLLPCN